MGNQSEVPKGSLLDALNLIEQDDQPNPPPPVEEQMTTDISPLEKFQQYERLIASEVSKAKKLHGLEDYKAPPKLNIEGFSNITTTSNKR
ncbi:hypothetical protein COB52_04775 [Candidatus Kaiserbacteria bacterium]|nr:MAG: hypothetical protein COB52_04775 [Candidatus Kaiserbacteria bacterium]